jgi:hypothetical protein
MRILKALQSVRARANSRLSAELPCARWFGTVLASAGLFLALCAAAVALIDPYRRYHKMPLVGPVYRDEYRMIPNMLRTADYDSVIAGSSICFNFSLADVRQLLKWPQPIKATASCCYPATYKLFTDMAITNRGVSRILTSVDLNAMAAKPGTHFIPLEPFLYSLSPLHECAYLFNADVVFDACVDVVKAHLRDGRRLNPDMMFCSDDGTGRTKYGRERVLKMMRDKRNTVDLVSMRREGKQETARLMIENFATYYLSGFRAHPEIEYVLFFPPYSELVWGSFLRDGTLDTILDVKARLIQEVLPLPNVRAYDFQAEVGVVTNLANYTDIVHYSPAINRLILERVAADQNRCGPDTAAANAETLRAVARRALPDVQ